MIAMLPLIYRCGKRRPCSLNFTFHRRISCHAVLFLDAAQLPTHGQMVDFGHFVTGHNAFIFRLPATSRYHAA